MTDIIDLTQTFHETSDPTKVIIANHQLVGDSFIEECRAIREAQDALPRCGEMLGVAKIPMVIYEQWMREGFDPAKEGMRKVVAKLKAESLDSFLLTSKSF